MKVKEVIMALLDQDMNADVTVMNLHDTRTEEEVDKDNGNFMVAQVDGDEDQVRMYYAGHRPLEEDESADTLDDA